MFAIFFVVVSGVGGSNACPDIGVPFYVYPDYWKAEDSLWVKVVSDLPLRAGQDRVLVVNPGDGVGAAPNAEYQYGITQLQAAGALVLGYISTQYGDRPTPEVLDEVWKYLQWYGEIDGVFLDEVGSGLDGLDYYSSLVMFITRLMPGSDVWLNHGTYPDEEYMNIQPYNHNSSVTLVTFEGPYTPDPAIPLDQQPLAYVNAIAPEWALNHHQDWRFSHIVFDVPSDELQNAFNLSAGMNAGRVYFTDDGLVIDANPYNSLPAYFEEMVNVCDSLGG